MPVGTRMVADTVESPAKFTVVAVRPAAAGGSGDLRK
jgi:hypothetical protein